MKYTTERTTTHIASTKCQYMREDSDTFRVLALHEPQSGEDHDDRQPGEADDDVERMQANQGVKGSSEQVGADRQAIVVDQPVPLARGACDENRSQCNRQRTTKFRTA